MKTDRNEQVGGAHYVNACIQPWDVIDTWPWDQRFGFYRGNALKYLMRAGSKGEPGEDIAKAEHYCRKLMDVLQEGKES